ncbi:hypothetical protein MKZ38_006088 [Zalerion maritima]|uniref:Uncharacterized protein n=1 Tax=Zalerion maritima TaxID=339359 RepID=A0AAD5RVM1_9PEZI|nr:hypothetical protein MKZ38_006088 [Zalerion maritima]
MSSPHQQRSSPTKISTFISHLLLLLSSIPIGTAEDNGKCYRRDGTEWTSELSSRLGTSDVYPCNPDAPVSHCCRAEDYCLSNGLCLNAEDDNWYTIQGCTTEVWEGPCVNEFQNDNGSEKVVIHVWACEFKETKDVIYCLGESNCCDHDGAATVLLPRWTDVYRPLAASTSRSSSASSTSTSEDDTTSASSSSSSDDQTLKIALGVGVGVGACLVASIIFLSVQIRRKNASNEKIERVLYYMRDNGQIQRPPTYRSPAELDCPPAELQGTISLNAPKSPAPTHKSVKETFMSPVKTLFSPSGRGKKF